MHFNCLSIRKYSMRMIYETIKEVTAILFNWLINKVYKYIVIKIDLLYMILWAEYF